MELSFRNADWGAKEMQRLACVLVHCSRLRSLFLFNNPIGDEGAKALVSSLASCSNLQKLELARCTITDDGAFALAEHIPKWKSLMHLDCRGNQIGPTAKAAIEKAIP